MAFPPDPGLQLDSLYLQLLDMSHRRWSPRNASVALEFGDIHSLATAAFVTSKLLPERGLDVAPPQQQHQLPPGPGPPQPLRTLPGWLTALAASLDRLGPRNVLTPHTSWTVQEVIAAEGRLLEIHHEVATYSPADWVRLFAARFSLKAEQLRHRTPPAVRSSPGTTMVPFASLKQIVPLRVWGVYFCCAGTALCIDHHAHAGFLVS